MGKGNGKAEEEAAESPKHLSAQAAMDPQSAIDLSQGAAWWGQQSDMSSAPDMAAISDDFAANAKPPAAGSIATEIAIRRARMVRPMLMPALVRRE